MLIILTSTGIEPGKVGFADLCRPCQPPDDDTSLSGEKEHDKEPGKLAKPGKSGFANPQPLPDKGKGDTWQAGKEGIISKFEDGDKDPWDEEAT